MPSWYASSPAFESCRNGTNVATILNITDSTLRQKLASIKAAPENSTGESVSKYCEMVHFNDYFWFRTCGHDKDSGALTTLLGGSIPALSLGVSVLGAGVWLLL